ncbi:MaoC family dehydratase N-terminal domain-containing protein [Comamonas aquatica]|nr:MaoC family dehydratase N-terminal domain-containing protein [Comamonas aquatica]
MALDYAQLKSAELLLTRQVLRPDDCIVYALGVGAGLDSPTNLGDETRFLYEERLEALPSQACVMAYPGFWMRDEAYGLDWRRIVNAELRIALGRRLPTVGELTSRTTVSAIQDKGQGRGALVLTERSVRDASGEELAVVSQLNFCKGDGGYSGSDSRLSDALPPQIPRPPQDAPFASYELATGHQQAAIYRLTGDRNPLHIDAMAAKAAGYPKPILHGAATAGMVCRVLASLPEITQKRFIRKLQIRFTNILFPGDLLRVDLWRIADRSVSFRCSTARDNGNPEVAYGTATWSDEQ